MFRLLLITFTLHALTACMVGTPADRVEVPDAGSGSNGSGEGRSELSVPEFLGALSKQKCDDAFTCMSTYPTSVGISFSDVFGESPQVCYAHAAERNDPAVVQTSAASGKIKYDSTSAKQCIAEITAPACATYWNSEPPYPEVCKRALVGTVPDGGTCAVDYECENPRST